MKRDDDKVCKEFRKVVDALRLLMRPKKLRYHHVADHLGVSETTVKRIFSGVPCNMSKIIKICDLCGITFIDLMSTVEKPREENHFLTEEQDAHFATYPGHLAVFRALRQGRSPSDIQKQWKITEAKLYKVLRQLEALGLLEVRADNQVTIRALGMLRLQEDGPFARKVTFGQNMDLMLHILDKMRNPDVCFHSVETHLTPEQITQLVDDIHQLGRRYRLLAQQSQRLYAAEHLESVRWLFAFSKYETDWTKYEI
jgi:hypothetical protein